MCEVVHSNPPIEAKMFVTTWILLGDSCQVIVFAVLHSTFGSRKQPKNMVWLEQTTVKRFTEVN